MVKKNGEKKNGENMWWADQYIELNCQKSNCKDWLVYSK